MKQDKRSYVFIVVFSFLLSIFLISSQRAITFAATLAIGDSYEKFFIITNIQFRYEKLQYTYFGDAESVSITNLV